MPVCGVCSKEFPNIVVIEGKKRNLCSRKYCLECSPFGQHNTRKLEPGAASAVKKYYCPCCNKHLSPDDFYRRRKNDTSPYCKICTSIVTTERAVRNKKLLVAYKGGACVDCGYHRYEGALEFHHLDPAQKDISASRLRVWSLSRAKSEADKCDLVCVRCHRLRHTEMAKSVRAEKLSLLKSKVCNGGRICNVCKLQLPLSEYSKRNPLCKLCDSNRSRSRQADTKKQAIKYLGGSCWICGFDSFASGFDFHHINEKQKSFGISKKLSRSIDQLKSELDKCALLCGCCHNELHAGLVEIKKNTWPKKPGVLNTPGRTPTYDRPLSLPL